LYQSQASFREALCDSFNTPIAVNVLRELVSRTNVYLNSRGKSAHAALIENIAQWVGSMLRMFGLGEGDPSALGWGQLEEDQGSANVGVLSFLKGPREVG